jgi:hypothetical protein
MNEAIAIFMNITSAQLMVLDASAVFSLVILILIYKRL